MSALCSTRSQLRAAAGVRSVAVPRPQLSRNIRVHATEDKGLPAATPTTTSNPQSTTGEKYPERVPQLPVNDALGTTGTAISDYTVFNPVTELINGRAAMLGIVAAIISEFTTHQAVWSQMAGKVVDTQLVERPSGQGFLLFAFVVAVTTLSTLIPRVNNGEKSEDRAFWPFTSTAELINGRAAQLGFLSLIIVEAITHRALFST